MRFTFTFTFTFTLAAWGLLASCASTDASKLSYFRPEDYKLDFLDPQKTSSMLAQQVTEKVSHIVDFIDQKLEPALAAAPPPAPQVIKIAMTKAKPIFVSAVQSKLKSEIDAHPEQVANVVQKYNVFAKQDPELGYEPLDAGNGEAKATIERVNHTLKDAYRTLRAMKVAHKMLVVAKADAAALKTKPDTTALAGVGIAALSVTDLTLSSIDEAKGLVPELQSLGKELTNEMQAKPLIAMDLTGPAAKVTGATNDLTALPADAGGVLSDVSDLIGLFGSGNAAAE